MFLGLGVSRVGLFREEEAAKALERALRLDPGLTQAHALLGDLYGRRNEWDAAVRQYEIAARQDPTDAAIRERLLAGKRLHQAEAEFDRLYSAHFVVKFPGPGDRQLARTVADRLEAIYLAVGRRLFYFPEKAVPVVLYPGQSLQAATLSPDWATGLFDGTIRLSADRVRQEGGAREDSLRHEYVHALVHELAGGHAPAWLSEGLAQVFERSVGAGSSDGGNVRRRDDPIPLNRLDGGFTGLPRRAAQDAYADSYAATQALIARYGMGRVRDLLAALAEQPDIALAFSSVLHERYEDFEAAWIGARTGRRF